MRFACDTGGTFTDLVVEDDDGSLSMFKASTTPDDPVRGVLDALGKSAVARQLTLAELLAKAEIFIHGTTHALNAIIENKTAKTAFFTSQNHPDVLVLREGGRALPFNHTVNYPDPYIPRALTYEIPGRITARGDIATELDVSSVIELLQKLKAENIEAISVCLLWSISNSCHEIRVGELIEQHLPGIPYSLSHQLNPTIREYRRASATSIDASLKPLMGKYLSSLTGRLTEAGFDGRILVMTSQGGMMDAGDLAKSPIHCINSGPSLAPIAGREYVTNEAAFKSDHDKGNIKDIIVADTGGTTYDISLVRGNRIPMTQETWIGEPYVGHMTGFPSVDVKSVGAGGGSIAWIDKGGMLHVGPQSAGAVPGPVCYGRGGTQATMTDACVALGYIDPDYFLGGAMVLDKAAARECIRTSLAEPLEMTIEQAAASVIALVTENMVQAIVDITVNQGIDPQNAVLIGGGGAAGLNSTFIARRLGCKELLYPELSAALSAAGGLICDLSADFRDCSFISTSDFDFVAVNKTLSELRAKCEAFIENSGQDSVSQYIEYSVEARYQNQVWTIDVPLVKDRFDNEQDVKDFVEAFDQAHERIFAIRDPLSDVEIVNWIAKAHCKLLHKGIGHLAHNSEPLATLKSARTSYFSEVGEVETRVYRFDALPEDLMMEGPAIVETPFTTIVVDPSASFKRTQSSSLVVYPFAQSGVETKSDTENKGEAA
ncbi:MAG: hydantoinase/oxoprolinase family protein [Gammaproteobacteria bacterium]|nr:MAG: hydantoinase/oxoprolinase family protein [Gammaproteobacteria bacterium]